MAGRNNKELSGEALANRLILRKLMPLLVVVYIVSFLDRTNIALARHSMSIDLGLSAMTYGLGAGLFFLTYSLAEVPSNLIMLKVGARRWITRIMITWGALSVGMAFVRGETSFYVMRLLLGLAEAGLYPGVMLYLTYWFGHKQRAKATGYFLLGVSIANVFGGPFGGALLELEGLAGLHGWQWLFIVEGIPAIALSFFVWKYLPDRPSAARWLSPEESLALEEKLVAERSEIPTAHGKDAILQCIKDSQLWLAILIYFCHQLTTYAVIFFLPSIIGAAGNFSPFYIGVLSAVPWIASGIGGVIFPRFATGASRSRKVLSGGLLTMGVGLLIAGRVTPILGLAALTLAASMFFVVQSVLFTIPASRFSGTVLAGALAFMNSCGLLGGFLGPAGMGFIEKTTGSSVGGFFILGLALVGVALLSLRIRFSDSGARAASEKVIGPEAV
ncbi:MFS transporter [Burkholderia aenigmatica]|uniref:MFS transporter n=1 Tax=Burkholderia aenigmatica TaxID=2015348 RepID=A0A228IN76_9BURK|nr:MFS transporter [Burkholderia aenigmatica]OXI43841.1 MFS transporter [Burkholderia aenigmatica]